MKIPRLSSGPLCYTLEQWAARMAISDITGGLIVAAVFFYLNSVFDIYDDVSKETDTDVDIDIKALQSWFIAIGVIFCIPIVFGILLLIALWNENKKLLLIWCGYSGVFLVVYTFFFLALAIFIFIAGLIWPGFLILVLVVVLDGHGVYSFLIIYSIYMKIKEKETTHTSYPQV